jgi:hypothetical protein
MLPSGLTVLRLLKLILCLADLYGMVYQLPRGYALRRYAPRFFIFFYFRGDFKIRKIQGCGSERSEQPARGAHGAGCNPSGCRCSKAARGVSSNPSGCCSPMQPGLQRESRRLCMGSRNWLVAILLHKVAARHATWSGKPGFCAPARAKMRT